MSPKSRLLGLAGALFSLLAARAVAVRAQPSYAAPNDGPNPYRTVTGWAQLPDGRTWGSTAGVDIEINL